MKKEYLSPTMVAMPIIEELSILETASGNLPQKSQGHNMDDEDEEYGLSRKKVGKFLYLISFSFLCIMEDTYLYHLASLVLPKDVLKYFSVVKIEPSPSLLRIHLDEKMEKELSDDLHFESKGFMDAVEVTDFPIRDHKVILVLRRRRWLDTRTGKSFSLPLQIDITASGTRYSKEFGAFLKETYGDIPSDLPYA